MSKVEVHKSDKKTDVFFNELNNPKYLDSNDINFINFYLKYTI